MSILTNEYREKFSHRKELPLEQLIEGFEWTFSQKPKSELEQNALRFMRAHFNELLLERGFDVCSVSTQDLVDAMKAEAAKAGELSHWDDDEYKGFLDWARSQDGIAIFSKHSAVKALQKWMLS